jgi:hypothetical protein
MARTYRRDARGRFAGGGFSGQSGGRGARLKAKGARAGGGAKVSAAKRSTPSGAIRKTDVIRARVSNGISKNIERRNKAGLNPPTAAKESKAARVKRATGRVAARSEGKKPETFDQMLARLNPAAAKRMTANKANAAQSAAKRVAKRGSAQRPSGSIAARGRRIDRAVVVGNPRVKNAALAVYRQQFQKYGTAGVPKSILKAGAARRRP